MDRQNSVVIVGAGRIGRGFVGDLFGAAGYRLVLVDVEEEGQELLTARAMVVSHDLYSAARLYGSSEIRTDQLIDGNLFVLDDYDEPSDDMIALRTLWQEHFDRGSSL